MQELAETEQTKFIKAVHYFGDQWPLNFWSSFTLAYVARDFAQIRADGFNCVILLLPLRVFIPATNAITLQYEKRLAALLVEAEKAGLSIILRVGYPHDICPVNTDQGLRVGRQLTILLHQSDEVYSRYLEHLAHVKSLVADSGNISHVFLSWEDSWSVMKAFPDLDEATRRALSRRMGFDRFVRVTLSDEVRAALALAGSQVIPIPKKGDPRFAIFKQFYDAYMHERFIAPLEDMFPNAAYEQRVDGQKIFDYKGNEHWLQFDGYRNKRAACFSYWAPFMGQKNNGEVISAETALQGLKRVESRVREKANRRHFIDQFNFINGTAEFTATAARIDPAEGEAFLEQALAYLERTTLGYGLWAYRDCRENYLVNGTFEFGSYNWDIEGAARITGEGPFWLTVRGPCRLRTEFFASRPLGKFKLHYGPFRLSVDLDRPIADESACRRIDIVVSVFGTSYPLHLVPGVKRQSVQIDFEYAERSELGGSLDIRIDAPRESQIALRDFQFFNHVLSNGIYGVDNETSRYMDVIRRFNTSAPPAVPGPGGSQLNG
jgi:hypothetical protein